MSSFSKGEKQYGLIIPKKQQVSAPKVGNVFGDDNGSDEDDGTDWVKKALKAESEKNKMKKQTKLNMQKALKEDPTIYQYDEVYDDMERSKSVKETKEVEKKPKYIQNLLKAAERRKKEQEHRIERMVQKEREAEGEMYADKESFVTSAYRAKLEEFKKMEEEEARMSRLEAIADVTKQQDISGFYRHLYEQTVENPKQSETEEAKTSEAVCEKTQEKDNSEPTKDSCSVIEVTEGKSSKDQGLAKLKKSRQYRQRIMEADDSDTESQTTEKKGDASELAKAKEADKDETKEPDTKRQKLSETEATPAVEGPETRIPTPPENSSTENSGEKPEEKESELDEAAKAAKEAEEIRARNERIALERKEKAKIWEKRTVGPVFEAALQRYYARKALRLSGS